VRRLLFLGLLAAALAQSAGAAAVDPARLVLRQPDVPGTYRLNARESGARTPGQDSVGFPGLKAKYRSWGHLAGYQIRFDKGDDSIVSRADVFRGRSGSRQMFAWFLAETQQQNTRIHLHPSALVLGDEGIVYTFAGGGVHFAVASWRYRRVFSLVGGAGLPQTKVLALARTQQRRVASALS
jgi:hypothetical protein